MLQMNNNGLVASVEKKFEQYDNEKEEEQRRDNEDDEQRASVAESCNGIVETEHLRLLAGTGCRSCRLREAGATIS